ncbi:MAG: DUF6291 domain-containing protein [Faecousia sp.]
MQNDGKSSFVLYDDWAVQLNKLTMEQRGVLITNVFSYKLGESMLPMDAVTDMLFSMIRAQLDRDSKRWEEKKERRKAAGSAGGRASGAARKTAASESADSGDDDAKQSFKNEANVPFASNLKQSLKNEANEAVTVNVPVPVTVPVTVPVPVPATVTVSTAGAVDNSAPAAADGESSLRDPALAKVMTAYMDRINPTPSQICVDELTGFARELGADVCIHAMSVALDEKKTQWSYIRAILRGYRDDGVRCIADIQTREEKRGKNRAREPDRKNGGFQRHGDHLSENAKKAVRQALEEADDG